MRLYASAILCLILLNCGGRQGMLQTNRQIVIFKDLNYEYSLSSDILKMNQFSYPAFEFRLDTSFECTSVVLVYNPFLHSYDGSHPRVADTILEKFTYRHGIINNSVDTTMDIQIIFSKELSEMTSISFSKENYLKISSDSSLLMIEHIEINDSYYGHNEFLLESLKRTPRKR